MEILKKANLWKNTLLLLVVLLTGSAAFGLGRLSILRTEKEPIYIENSVMTPATTTASIVATSSDSSPSASSSSTGTYVASKTGKSYYFPWCATVKRIKPENLISFSTKDEAVLAGYKPGNCAGLK